MSTNIATISGKGFTLTVDLSKLTLDMFGRENKQENRIATLTGTGVGMSRYSRLFGDCLDVSIAVRLLKEPKPTSSASQTVIGQALSNVLSPVPVTVLASNTPVVNLAQPTVAHAPTAVNGGGFTHDQLVQLAALIEASKPKRGRPAKTA